MAKLEIKYRLERNALPPRPIRIAVPGWGGSAEFKKVDGSQPQPWHCPLHTTGATHGVELLFQYDQECHIVNDGDVRIEWEGGRDPLGGPGTGDFTLSIPRPPQNYLFNTSIDIQTPPGYVVRCEPHPRFFADMTHTAPAAVYGHVHGEWWPKPLFMVFKIPAVGQRHIFRKGEPYAMLLFIPEDDFELRPMSEDEQASRRKLDQDIKLAKSLIAKHVWHSAGGIEFNDHYKVLQRAYDRGGMSAVDEMVNQAVQHYEVCVPKDKPTAEKFQLAAQFHASGKFTEAKELLHHILRTDPSNADAFFRIAMLEWDLGVRDDAVRTIGRALALQPRWPPYHNQLGEFLRRMGRLDEAEAEFRSSVALDPSDPESLATLGLTVAQGGRMDEGLGWCRQAIALGPTMPSPHFIMGMILSRQGRAGEAKASYEAALNIDPQYQPALQAVRAMGTLA